MEQSASRERIIEIKAMRAGNPRATYSRIIEQIKEDGQEAGISVGLSSLRRVCAKGSEANASSFSFDNILTPIYNALKHLQEIDNPNMPGSELLDSLKSMIHIQDEEIALLHESREQQQSFIALLLDQLEKKDRRMDEKDEIIRRFMAGELTVSKADSAR